MKKLTNKNTAKSLLSLAIVGVFIFLAVGSYSLFPYDVVNEQLDDGQYKQTSYYQHYSTESITGHIDKYGRYEGAVSITITNSDGDYTTEEVNMVNGRRHGVSQYTNHGVNGLSSSFSDCYNMGVSIDCEKSATASFDPSAYDVLFDKYPWYATMLIVSGFDHGYLSDYTDTIETLLGNETFTPEEFDDTYSSVMSTLGGTKYDSIINLADLLTYRVGSRAMKEDEIRLAVFDGYYNSELATFSHIQTTYPNYIALMGSYGIVEVDFEEFCSDLDSALNTYDPLDVEDPYFIDSVDSYLTQALLSFYGEPELKRDVRRVWETKTSLNSKRQEITKLLNQSEPKFVQKSSMATTSDVAEVVLVNIYANILSGDLIKEAVIEAYLRDEGIALAPVVTTEIQNKSGTTITVGAYIHDDGGAVISDVGIAWATHNNPEINDNTFEPDIITSHFTTNLENLTAGTTYYFRTYAVNSAGISYGNCESYTAEEGGTSGIASDQGQKIGFEIYPNPAASNGEITIKNTQFQNGLLTIYDSKGQIVMQENFTASKFESGQFTIQLENFKPGTYICHISNKGNNLIKKLIIN